MNEIFAWVVGLLSFIPGVGQPAAQSWNGYVEVDYVYAAAASAGTIAEIGVAEGQTVSEGQVLFKLEASQQQAQYDTAKAQTASAQATLDNLKTGSRPEELQVTEASLAEAQANAALAQQTFTRTEDLYRTGNTPKSQLDQTRASLDAAQAAVRQLQAQLAVAQLPARDAEIKAAEANVVAALGSEAAAQAALEDRTVAAPEGGRIERLFYKTGEVVGTGSPVLSISGAEAFKVKFYINEADRHQFALGQQVSVSCDGCASGMAATVSYFASDPQYTPPIIYSRDERSRLVFLTEATLASDAAILPGQPVSIGLLP
jgi:HlyD family secretion protein